MKRASSSWCVAWAILVFLAAEAFSQTRLLDLYADKARYNPGDMAQVIVVVSNATAAPVTNQLRLAFSCLAEPRGTITQAVVLAAHDARSLSIPWRTGPQDFTGYGVDADLLQPDGSREQRSHALDASSDWRRFPRMGFFSDYDPGQNLEECRARTLLLAKHHINVIQFYDWMYTHDRLLPENWEAEPDVCYREFGGVGRELSLRVIRDKLLAAHDRNMAGLAYSLIYGATSTGACPAHLEWAAFNQPAQTAFDQVAAHVFGAVRIHVMDCSNPQWQSHILGQFREALRVLPFDGVHLDNLGAAVRYRYHSDKAIPEAEAFPAFINQCAAALQKVQPGAAVTHNAVMGQYRETIAQSAAAIYYEEVWERDSYWDLRNIILDSQRASAGRKPVVLAAYLNRYDLPTNWINEPSVRLANAAIFAHGGFHLELGERGELLSNEYFPYRAAAVAPGLQAALRAYYNVLVRYENLLSYNAEGGITDGTEGARISSSTHALSKTATPDTLWTVVRLWPDRYDTVNLINLHGTDWAWRNQSPAPQTQTNIHMRYYLDRPCRHLHLATPDDGLGRPQALPFEAGQDPQGHYVDVVIPRLEYWNLLIFNKAAGHANTHF